MPFAQIYLMEGRTEEQKSGITGPVSPAQMECSSIGSQVGTVRTVQIAQADNARRQRAGHHHRLGFEDAGHTRLQGLIQLCAPLYGADESKSRVYEQASPRGLGRAQCAPCGAPARTTSSH